MTYRLSIERNRSGDSRYTERRHGLALIQAIGAPMGAAPPITINDP